MRICRSCCGTNATITVEGCFSLVLPGATVAVSTGGSLIFTGTTNGSGQVSLTVNPSTSYSIVTTSTRFVTNTTTWTTGATGPFAKTVGPLTAASGYACTSFCAEPFKTTLNGTVGGQAYTLIKGGGLPGTGGWYGCQDFPIGQLVANPSYPASGNPYIAGSGSTPIGLALFPAGAGAGGLELYTLVNCNPPPCGTGCIGGFGSSPSVSCSVWASSGFGLVSYAILGMAVTVVSCPPALLITFTMPATQSLSCGGFVGSTSYTLTYPFSGGGTITE
jgi:hypothetical protein